MTGDVALQNVIRNVNILSASFDAQGLKGSLTVNHEIFAELSVAEFNGLMDQLRDSGSPEISQSARSGDKLEMPNYL